jgi:hypothetical protein
MKYYIKQSENFSQWFVKCTSGQSGWDVIISVHYSQDAARKERDRVAQNEENYD